MTLSDSNESPPGGSPPWQRPDLLPTNSLGNQWGVYRDGKAEPKSIDSLIAEFRQGPGKEQWNGKTERAPIAFVADPASSRVLPVSESVTFQPIILERDAEALSSLRSKNGWGFLILAAICIGFALIGIGKVSFLPALYAMSFGAACLEAHVALRRLRSDPVSYLEHLAAQARHVYWQGLEGSRGLARTFGMAAVWIAIGAAQFIATFLSRQERPDILAAALIKTSILGEPWRLMTGPMLHGSIMHLLMNVSALIALGPVLERCVHRNLLAPVWLTGALGGSLLSWATLPATSVGASGGLMGIFGLLFVVSWRRRTLLPADFLNSLMRSLLITVVFGILAWDVIDNAAHLGGFLVGGTIGLILFRRPAGELPLPESKRMRAAGWMSELIFVGLALYTVFRLLTFR